MLLALPLAVAVMFAAADAPPKKGSKKSSAHAPKAPPGPEWLGWKPGCRLDAGKGALIAVGRSEEKGDAAAQTTQAEDDGRQHLGEAVAAWQERCLRCAKQASETKVKATSSLGHGLVNFTIESATEVSLYQEHVDARAPDGKRSAVLLKQDLEMLLNGIAYDDSRSAALREAVKECGQQAFDELAKAK